MITTRILLVSLAISLSGGPAMAVDADLESLVDAGERKPQAATLWQDTKTIAKGMLLLACAYKLSTPLNKSYKDLCSLNGLNSNSSKQSPLVVPRNGLDAFMAKAGVGVVGSNSSSDNAELRLQRPSLIMPSGHLLAYGAAVVACAALGMDYIIRGLHLEKPLANTAEKVGSAMRDFYVDAKNKVAQQASRLKR